MSHPERQCKITPLIISLAFFMEAVDTTVINTAIPTMAQSLRVDPVDLKVALISYLLSLAIFIPISGWLADKFGAKKMFMTALITFSISSLWCGFAHNVPTLILARFVQGFGGALSLPVGRLIIVRSFTKQQFINTMTRITMIGAVGMMLGPVIGGFITQYLSWHWIFWINIPIGLCASVLAAYYLPNTPPVPVPPLDKLGFILFGISLSGTVFGLSALSESQVGSHAPLPVLFLSLLLFIAYILHSRTQQHPIVKTSLFQLRTFRVATLSNLISRLGLGGVPFLVPLLLQISFAFSAQLSGLMLAPLALGILFSKPFFLPLLRHFGYKRFLITNTLSAGCIIMLFACINNSTSLFTICGLTFLYGITLSLQYSGMNSLAFSDITTENLSAATSIMSTLQQLAQSFGVAISALCIRLFSENLHLTPTVFHYTFITIGIVTLLAAFIFMHLRREDGQQMHSTTELHP